MSTKNPLIVTTADGLATAAEKLHQGARSGSLNMTNILDILAGTITPGATWSSLASRGRPALDSRASSRLAELGKYLPQEKSDLHSPILHVGGEIWVHFPGFDRVTPLRARLTALQVIAVSEILDQLDGNEGFVFCLPEVTIEISPDYVRFTRTSRSSRVGSIDIERDTFEGNVAQQRETILETLLGTPVGQCVYGSFRTMASGDPDILAAIELGEVEPEELLSAYGRATLSVFGKIALKDPDWMSCAQRDPEELAAEIRGSYAPLLRAELGL